MKIKLDIYIRSIWAIDVTQTRTLTPDQIRPGNNAHKMWIHSPQSSEQELHCWTTKKDKKWIEIPYQNFMGHITQYLMRVFQWT